MKICTVYRTTLRVHPLFPLILLPCVFAGQGVMIAAYLLTLLLHECGHWWAASRLRLTVSEIELTPFGGCMEIGLSDGLRGRGGLLLASAGVLVNLVCAVMSCVLLRFRISPFLSWFALANLSMLAVNLLPVLPLDGGRMLLSVLSLRFSRPAAFRVLITLGRLLAAALVAYSLASAVRGHFHASWALLGCYLLYASAREEKRGSARYLSALFSRRFKMENDAALPVQHLCVRADMPLFLLLPQLQPRAYHLVSVLDDAACGMIGTLREDQLYDAVLRAPSATVRQIIEGNVQK